MKCFSLYKPALSIAGIAFFIMLFGPVRVSAQDRVSKTKAQGWVNHGSWRKGLPEKPHSSINAVEFFTQYHQHQVWWDRAFAFMKRKDLATLPVGKYPIDGDHVFATISDYAPKDTSEIKWEAHRNYADIQFLIKGKEQIGLASAASLKEIVPYNTEKDAANYSGPGKYYVARPGTFFIFFPGQAHRPNLKTDDTDTAMVRKVVIKMRIP